MYYRDRDRLLISALISVVLYGILFLLLRNTTWSAEPFFPERRGPILVTLEPLQKPPVPEVPEREEPAPPPEPEVQPPPEPEPQPAPAERSKPVEAAPEGPPPAPRRTTPPAPTGEGGTAGPTVPAASEGEGESAPAETLDDGVIEEEAPADIRGESKIVYADEPLQPEDDGPGTPEETEEEPDEWGFNLDEEGLDSALEQPVPGDTVDPPGAGGAGGAGTAEESRPEHINIDFETPGADRKLLSWKDPDLTGEQISRIPPRTEVIVGFTISPEGYPSGLSVVRSSGSADVDAAVMKAMRLWRFEKINNPDVRVEARVRYVIQTR